MSAVGIGRSPKEGFVALPEALSSSLSHKTWCLALRLPSVQILLLWDIYNIHSPPGSACWERIIVECRKNNECADPKMLCGVDTFP